MLQLDESNRQRLLHLARLALEEGVRKRELAEMEEEPEGALREFRGAFVTLWKAGRLRGCIGYVEAQKPLYQTVRECAIAAALRDPRFDPVIADELPALALEISVLSPLTDVAPDQVEVGLHGLMISRGPQRGLLLPQVAVEWKWDRERFLQETCLKAGLPPEAWRHGARIQAFTAEAFRGTARSNRPTHHAA